jgi:CDP-diacylglycerol pyrophosphatase
MNPVTGRIRFRHRFTILHLAALALFLAVPAFGADGRDVLWKIVSTCLDTGAADYCTACIAPRAEAGCNRSCGNTTQVWAESKEFVAMRDRKMCGCPGDFVHGLALPRSRVTGIEDPRRPEGIWQFAWEAAKKKMNESEIALAVNPENRRSQDQLHVHIVRALRQNIPTDPRRTALVDDLGSVWKAVARLAAERAWRNYGVLVVKAPGSGYLVVIDEGSTEYTFTRAECR